MDDRRYDTREIAPLVDVTPEETTAQFRGLDTFDPNAEASTFARFRVVEGRPGIEVLA